MTRSFTAARRLATLALAPLALAPLALGTLALSATGAQAAQAPRLHEATFNQLAQPLPYPYNESGDAHADIAKARARAKASHKLLLIDMGGNWCPDCRILAGTIELPDLKPFVKAHYEVVTVDVGRFNKNLDISAAYGIARPAGVPAVLIIDPRTNQLVNKGHETALSDARSMSPQALADWLAQWTR